MPGLRRLLPPTGFVLVAIALTWPLVQHLTTRLTGAPTGDTGVYVWNPWIFRHELLGHLSWPFTTDHLFAATGGTDLIAHNYTVFADVLALPMLGVLEVAAAFNVIYLFLVALSGYGAFLLVKQLVGRTAEAWIAGAVFAASPFLIARGTGHFSLAAAASLPIFVLLVLRTLKSGGRRDAVLAGLALGWAGYCDPYYAIYCALMGALLVAHHLWTVVPVVPGVRRLSIVRVVDALLALGVLLVAWRLWQGEGSAVIFGRTITFRTLYTPMLVLTLLALLRLQLVWRLRLRRRSGAWSLERLARLSAATLATAALILSPVVVGIALHLAAGSFPSPSINWRSSPPGMDVLDLLIPNPNHPWFGGPGMAWIMTRGPLAYPEFVGSLSLVALAIIGLAIRHTRSAVPTLWILFTGAFVLLALGPFVHVAGLNTHVPGPWALLRYVPGVELARSPTRFAVVAALGLSILLGFALASLRDRWPRPRRLVLAAAAALLAFELAPAPRPLHDARIPAIYGIIRDDANDAVRVLELPGGVRDGTSSIGDFNASSQYFQTGHGKPLIGGYQSRVSEAQKQRAMESPVLAALYRLSERQPVSPELAAEARAAGASFLTASCLGYVVIDRERASPDLEQFAIELFELLPIMTAGDRALFVPASRPRGQPCDPGAPSGSV
jgi:hypothetical protein